MRNAERGISLTLRSIDVRPSTIDARLPPPLLPSPGMPSKPPPEQDPDRDRMLNPWATGATGCLLFLAIAFLALGVLWFFLGGFNDGYRL